MDFSKMTLGVIVGNRDFFPDRLISEGRQDVLQVLAEMGIDVVIPSRVEYLAACRVRKYC